MMKKTERFCPRCGKRFIEPPAISRVDNQKEICPECGLREALIAIGIKKADREAIVRAVQEQKNKL